MNPLAFLSGFRTTIIASAITGTVAAALAGAAVWKARDDHWRAREAAEAASIVDSLEQSIQRAAVIRHAATQRNIELRARLDAEERANARLLSAIDREREADESPVLDEPLPDGTVDRVNCVFAPSRCPHRGAGGSGADGRPGAPG